MFDLAWSEIAIIGVVALVVVGPKDLPKLMRSAGQMAARARRIADEFRGQMNEAMREADLDDLKKSIDDIKSLNPKNMIRDEMVKLAEPVKSVADDMRHEWQDIESKAAASAGDTLDTVKLDPAAGPEMAAPPLPHEIDVPLPEPLGGSLEVPPAFDAPPVDTAGAVPVEPVDKKPLDLAAAGSVAPRPAAPGSASEGDVRV